MAELMALATSASSTTSSPASGWLPWVSLVVGTSVAVVGYLINQRQARRERKAKIFSSAVEAVVAYMEMPYRVRRRAGGDPQERSRLANQMSDIQERLAFHSAWIGSESAAVAKEYSKLVASVRKEAGEHMREAWKADPIQSDSEVSISKGYEYKESEAAKDAMVVAVRAHLRKWFPDRA